MISARDLIGGKKQKTPQIIRHQIAKPGESNTLPKKLKKRNF